MLEPCTQSHVLPNIRLINFGQRLCDPVAQWHTLPSDSHGPATFTNTFNLIWDMGFNNISMPNFVGIAKPSLKLGIDVYVSAITYPFPNADVGIANLSQRCQNI